MSALTTQVPDEVAEASRILREAEEKAVVLRALGGVAVYLRCPSARSGAFARKIGDVDLIGHARQAGEIKRLLSGLGYAPMEEFNALHGSSRLGFADAANRRFDVFLDVFEMNHRFDFEARLAIDSQTLSLADLLATKLQVVQTNEKDLGDATCILVDHEVGETDAGDTVNGARIGRLCSSDWGVYKTFTMKLAMLTAAVDRWGLTEQQKDAVVARAGALVHEIERAPKSLGWKMRAGIGERKRWYEIPEEDSGLVGQAGP